MVPPAKGRQLLPAATLKWASEKMTCLLCLKRGSSRSREPSECIWSFLCTSFAFSAQWHPDRWITMWYHNIFSPFLVLFRLPPHAVQIIHRVVFSFQSARRIGPDARTTLCVSFPFFLLTPCYSFLRPTSSSFLFNWEAEARRDVWRDRWRGKWILHSSQSEGTALCEAGRVTSVPSHKPHGTKERLCRETGRGIHLPASSFIIQYLGKVQPFSSASRLWNKGRVWLMKCCGCLLLMTSRTLCLNITNFVQVNSIISQLPHLKLPLLTELVGFVLFRFFFALFVLCCFPFLWYDLFSFCFVSLCVGFI